MECSIIKIITNIGSRSHDGVEHIIWYANHISIGNEPTVPYDRIDQSGAVGTVKVPFIDDAVDELRVTHGYSHSSN